MWWWHGEIGTAVWLLMTIGMVAFWALVIWAVAAAIRAIPRAQPTRRAEDILAERFASGEIDEETYRERLAVLRREAAGRSS